MNSPVLAMAKNVVVRQLKTAVSRGKFKSSWLRMATIRSMVYGCRLLHFEADGVRVTAALRSVSVSVSWSIQVIP